MKRIAFSLVFASVAVLALGQPASFALHKGDRVVFYGDSITDNGPYTYFVEAFVSERYPQLGVSFMNAGVGGDRVSGGWMGPIDQRMTRDLFSRKPTVVTVMLGMNDASYSPFTQGVFDAYSNGYRHMIDRMKKEAPDARAWLVQPSPFDDVATPPNFQDGYNSVLLRYAGFVRELAGSNGYQTVDFNTPVTDALRKAVEVDANAAKRIIPDRVHPSSAGHLVMATALLKAWNASPLVAETTLDWTNGQAITNNSEVTGWKSGSFTLLEKTLPMPIDRNDPTMALVLKSSDVETALNRETLTITHMPFGSYGLRMDGKVVGVFTADDFGNGIDLSKLDTPMMRQAQAVSDLTWKLAGLRYNRWRQFEYNLADVELAEKNGAIRSMERLEGALSTKRMKTAMPVAHQVDIVRTK